MFHAFKTHTHISQAGLRGLRRSRAWPIVLLTLILAQWALLVHQFEHHVELEATASEDCTLCSFASHLAAPPPAQTYVPSLPSTTAHIYAVASQTVTVRETPSDFQARAPPSVLSA